MYIEKMYKMLINSIEIPKTTKLEMEFIAYLRGRGLPIEVILDEVFSTSRKKWVKIEPDKPLERAERTGGSLPKGISLYTINQRCVVGPMEFRLMTMTLEDENGVLLAQRTGSEVIISDGSKKKIRYRSWGKGRTPNGELFRDKYKAFIGCDYKEIVNSMPITGEKGIYEITSRMPKDMSASFGLLKVKITPLVTIFVALDRVFKTSVAGHLARGGVVINNEHPYMCSSDRKKTTYSSLETTQELSDNHRPERIEELLRQLPKLPNYAELRARQHVLGNPKRFLNVKGIIDIGSKEEMAYGL